MWIAKMIKFPRMLGMLSWWTQEKFTTLSLAFKTDRQTLDQRLEVHLRARDVAENNIRKELAAVRDGLRVCDTEMRRLVLSSIEHYFGCYRFESCSPVTSITWLRGYFAGIRFWSLELKIRKKSFRVISCRTSVAVISRLWTRIYMRSVDSVSMLV